MSKIINIVEKSNDNSMLDVMSMLEYAQKDIKDKKENEEYSPNKAVLLLLETDKDGYQPSWYAANMKTSEMVALLSILTKTLIDDMGF